MPEPPVTSVMSAQASPIARRCSSLTASTTTMRFAVPPRLFEARRRSPSTPRSTLCRSTSPTFASSWRCNTRTRLASRIGVSGWSLHRAFGQQRVADEQVALIDRARGWREKRGTRSVKSAPIRSSSASATGPMLPLSVELKVEQYLNIELFGAGGDRSAGGRGDRRRDRLVGRNGARLQRHDDRVGVAEVELAGRRADRLHRLHPFPDSVSDSRSRPVRSSAIAPSHASSASLSRLFRRCGQAPKTIS